MTFSWKAVFAIRKRFDSMYNGSAGPLIPQTSGIYLWTRKREDGSIGFYVGQAHNLYNRRFDYYKIQCGISYPTRKFEASLKKHKDWTYKVLEVCDINRLDEREKFWINYYMCLPNYITYNQALTDFDQVRSNYRRIKQIENRQNKAFEQCFKYLTTQIVPNGLKIGLKCTKKGVPTALSKKYFEKLLELLKIKELNNGNKI